jgi:transcription elongation GreA/GreB family factor
MKKEIIKYICEELLERNLEFKRQIESTIESLNNETKSSAGDKYETSREMTSREFQNIKETLVLNASMLDDLQKIDAERAYHRVELGSLVITNEGNYFISVAFGKIKIEGKECYAISKSAPLAKAMLGMSIGERIKFQQRSIEIKNIM